MECPLILTQAKYLGSVYNIGNRLSPVKLLPLQEANMVDTYADVDDLVQDIDYKFNTSIHQRIK